MAAIFRKIGTSNLLRGQAEKLHGKNFSTTSRKAKIVIVFLLSLCVLIFDIKFDFFIIRTHYLIVIANDLRCGSGTFFLFQIYIVSVMGYLLILEAVPVCCIAMKY